MAVGVRHFDTHRVFAGNRRYDSHARHTQRDRQVVRKVRDLRQTQTGFQFDFVLRDDGAGFNLDHLHVEAEAGERIFEDARLLKNFLLLRFKGEVVSFEQQIHGRQLIVVRIRQIGSGGVEVMHYLLALFVLGVFLLVRPFHAGEEFWCGYRLDCRVSDFFSFLFYFFIDRIFFLFVFVVFVLFFFTFG